MNASHSYWAFGLTIHADLPLPALLTTPKIPAAVWIQSTTLPETMPNHPDHFFFTLPHIGRFLIQQGTHIFYHRAVDTPWDVLPVFLLGSCMGALLQQRGYVVLHGNALCIAGSQATIILGHQGAGKSTFSAWHIQQGAQLLADDLSVIDMQNPNIPMVLPGYPHLKLWQDSLALLNLETPRLSVRPGQAKFLWPLHNHFMRQAVPIREIIELDPEQHPQHPITGAKKLACLLRHSYRYAFLEKMQRTTSHHQKLLLLSRLISMRTQPRTIVHKCQPLCTVDRDRNP